MGKIIINNEISIDFSDDVTPMSIQKAITVLHRLHVDVAIDGLDRKPLPKKLVKALC